MRKVGRVLCRVAPVAALLALVIAAPASAGRVIATGHDADDHCAANEPQCQLLRVAVDYARGAAPNPASPLLLLSCSTILDRGIQNAYAGGAVPGFTTVCPTGPTFASTQFSTASFSAIVVGSSYDSINQGGVPSDSQALAARKGEIAAFFNAGGGIVALAGDAYGDGDPATGQDNYYDFVPLPAVGKKVQPPFTLTPEGQQLGIQDSMHGAGTVNAINCCPTHNSFDEPPAGSALRVAERDGSTPPAPETLFGEGSISGGGITSGPPPAAKTPVFGPGGVAVAPSNKKCVSRRNFRIRIRHRPGVTVEQAIVFVNGKRVAVRKGKRLTAPVDLRGLPKGRFLVRITVITTTGRVIVGNRRYRTCTPKRRPGTRPPL